MLGTGSEQPHTSTTTGIQQATGQPASTSAHPIAGQPLDLVLRQTPWQPETKLAPNEHIHTYTQIYKKKKAKQSKTKQSKAKQSDFSHFDTYLHIYTQKQSNAKQSKAKQSKEKQSDLCHFDTSTHILI